MTGPYQAPTELEILNVLSDAVGGTVDLPTKSIRITTFEEGETDVETYYPLDDREDIFMWEDMIFRYGKYRPYYYERIRMIKRNHPDSKDWDMQIDLQPPAVRAEAAYWILREE